MRGPLLHPVVIAAGGTGGHLFPAMALASELVRRNHRVALLTDARAAGVLGDAFAGRECFVIAGAGIAGRGVWRGAQAIGAIGRGTVQARVILARLAPSVLVGFGGYPSVAPILATRLLARRPAVLLHEQNAVLGRANRLLARFADALALSFPATAGLPPKIVTSVAGNPVRAEIAALAGRGYVPPQPGAPIRLLVLGGALGARVLSTVVPPALAGLPAALRARLSVVQQCREADLAAVRAVYAAAGIAAELAPFFADVAARLAGAHLLISRAGASSVAEIAAIGRPAVLVPLPGAIDDHQSANARALGAGARVLAEPG
jgi:UDP-N-acetylglucosamine--N-acetylmuramyl-(pentapeptide) pyrophosphoryl-undecaprenol N-acetylglucosamine transferase